MAVVCFVHGCVDVQLTVGLVGLRLLCFLKHDQLARSQLPVCCYMLQGILVMQTFRCLTATQAGGAHTITLLAASLTASLAVE